MCTPAGIPITWALADPELDEREVLAAMLDLEAELVTARPGLLLIADKGFNVAVRVAQRILAMAAAIWHNHHTGQPTTRSLIAFDH